MSLKSLLSTVLSPSQEDNIAANASHCLSLIVSSPSILTEADEPSLTKFKVRVSALVKSKQPIARWFGCYLCKVAVESKCYSILKSHGGTWAGLLQHVLEVKEPLVTHQIAIQALSTLFSATYGKPNFTKEITTSRLPEYVKQLFVLAGKEPQLWHVIVPALSKTLSQQSTTFRPFVHKAFNLFTEVLRSGVTGSNNVTDKLIQDTCEAMVLLHMSAPKGKEQEEWRNSIICTISEINYTISEMSFELVDEETPKSAHQEPKFDWLQNIGSDIISLTDKLRLLLQLLYAFFTTPTKCQVNFPYGEIMLLADRLYTLPFSTEKQGVETDRKRLFYGLIDRINVNVTQLVIKSITVIGHPAVMYLDSLMHHITILISRRPNIHLKLSLFKLAANLMKQSHLLPSSYTVDLGKLISTALPMVQIKQPTSAIVPDMVSAPDAFTEHPDKITTEIIYDFLSTAVETCPNIPLHQRAQIDGLFIMNAHQNTMLSGLYPGVCKHSIAPMAIRTNPESTFGSLLIHPRLPPLSQANQDVLTAAKLTSANESNEVSQRNEHDEEMAEFEQKQQSTFISHTEAKADSPINEELSKPEDNVQPETFTQPKTTGFWKQKTETIAPQTNVTVSSEVVKETETTTKEYPSSFPPNFQPSQFNPSQQPSQTQEETNSNEESDIEIPTIDVGSDSDDDL
jgi:pre-rRNA-processing protein RIX1